MNGNSSTLGRNARARQISAPIPTVPPPPENKKEKKQKKSKQSSSHSLSGTLRPKSGYTNGGTLIRQQQQQQHPHNGMAMHMQQNHGGGMYAPLPMHAQQLPPSRFHTFSHRGYANGIPHSTSVPHLHMIPMHAPPPMQMPLMLPQQYATLQHPSKLKSKKKKDKLNIPLGIPVPPPIFAYPPPSSMMHEPPMNGMNRPLAMSNRKLAQSAAAGLDDSGNSGAESNGDTGTGIYRRKGHMNERAFSYSIRQEHRSRSHGSLASLQFNNPPDVKKEREIAQMVAGLDLNDDATIYRRSHQPQMNGGTFGKRK